ncbi:MAG: response regulator [Planctomycetota bacterium]|jgi:DNA-binding NtrC family response regulator
MATIILAEDEVALSKIYKKWLEAAGHSVVQAKDGLEGLRATTFGGGNADLLITDVMMPNADGEELVTSFSMLSPDHPIIVVTACADQEKLRRIKEDPMVYAVLSKPVAGEQLVEVVREALEPETGS